MDLRDWTITMESEPPADAHNAGEVDFTYGRKIAKVRVHPRFSTDGPEWQRYVLVHELVHVILYPMVSAACDGAEAMSQSSFKVMWSNLRSQQEYAVDQLARLLAPLYPTLPEFEESERPRPRAAG